MEDSQKDEYILMLKKENVELRKLILEKNKEIENLISEVDALNDDSSAIYNSLCKAGERICELMKIEPNEDNIEKIMEEFLYENYI